MLCAATTSQVVINRSFFKTGESVTETKIASSTASSTTFSYDRQGNLAYLVYPDSAALGITYNTFGKPNGATWKPSGGATSTLVSDIDYAPHGKISFIEYGSGVYTNRTYDPSELLRLKAITTTRPVIEGESGGGPMAFALPMRFYATTPAAPLAQFIIENAEQQIDELLQSITGEEPSSEPKGEGAVPVTKQQPRHPRPCLHQSKKNPSEGDTTPPGIETTTLSEEVASTPEMVLAEAPATETVVALGEIHDALFDKSAAERAEIKSAALANAFPTGEYTDTTYGLRIKVDSIAKIHGGIELYARAWKDNEPLGFGADGSVEIERFKIYNPPILVEDPNGSIVETWTSWDEDVQKTRRWA